MSNDIGRVVKDRVGWYIFRFLFIARKFICVMRMVSPVRGVSHPFALLRKCCKPFSLIN